MVDLVPLILPSAASQSVGATPVSPVGAAGVALAVAESRTRLASAVGVPVTVIWVGPSRRTVMPS